MGIRGVSRALLVATALALVITGGATAEDDTRGIDPNQDRSLVEVILPNKAAAIELQLNAGAVRNRVQRPLPQQERQRQRHRPGLRRRRPARRPRGAPATSWARRSRTRTPGGTASPSVRPTSSPRSAAQRGRSRRLLPPQGQGASIQSRRRTRSPSCASTTSRTTPASFLSVEAKDLVRGSSPTSTTTVALSWNTGAGTPIDAGPRTMNVNVDPDTTPDTYIEHRELVRIGDGVPAPTMVRIGSEHRRVRGGAGQRLARRRPAADELDLPERLRHPLHGPDRGQGALHRARRGVPEHRDARAAAAQDERLPAEGAGDPRRQRDDAVGRSRGRGDRRFASRARPGSSPDRSSRSTPARTRSGARSHRS